MIKINEEKKPRKKADQPPKTGEASKKVESTEKLIQEATPKQPLPTQGKPDLPQVKDMQEIKKHDQHQEKPKISGEQEQPKAIDDFPQEATPKQESRPKAKLAQPQTEDPQELEAKEEKQEEPNILRDQEPTQAVRDLPQQSEPAALPMPHANRIAEHLITIANELHALAALLKEEDN